MPKITVITVVKNNFKGIEKTIKSVLNQKQKKIDHIIIDGMSNDGTSEIISKYKKKLRHIREPDKGIYSALNKGIKKAKGEFIAILHSGDVYYNEFSLERAIKFMEINNLNASSYNMVYQQKGSIIRYWKMPIKKINKINCFKIAHPTLIVKKELISNLKYHEEKSISSDYKFLLQLVVLKKLRYKYNDHILQLNEYGGVSTSKKYIFTKLKEDLKILLSELNAFYIYIIFYKIFSKINSFIIQPEKYDILYLNFYFADEMGVGDNRHLNFFKYLSKIKSKILILGCSQNQFQKNKKYKKQYLNHSIVVEDVNSLKYKNTLFRILSILIFNFKLLLNYKKFQNCKKIYLSVPDYSTIVLAIILAKIFEKKIIVEFRDVYPENIKPYFKYKFIYKIVKFILNKIKKIAIENCSFTLTNLKYFSTNLKENNIKYSNKLVVVPNICGFKNFNRSKNFVYAGNTSKVNDYKKISEFMKKLKLNSFKINQFTISKSRKKVIGFRDLKVVLKKFGFGLFSFNNFIAEKYGINHKKLNLYYDNGVIPIFLGNKKLSKYFFSHFPILFLNHKTKDFKYVLKNILNHQKKCITEKDEIKKTIVKTNLNTFNKLKQIFIYN